MSSRNLYKPNRVYINVEAVVTGCCRRRVYFQEASDDPEGPRVRLFKMKRRGVCWKTGKVVRLKANANADKDGRHYAVSFTQINSPDQTHSTRRPISDFRRRRI